MQINYILDIDNTPPGMEAYCTVGEAMKSPTKLRHKPQLCLILSSS